MTCSVALSHTTHTLPAVQRAGAHAQERQAQRKGCKCEECNVVSTLPHNVPSVCGSQNAAEEVCTPAPTFCSRCVVTARGGRFAREPHCTGTQRQFGRARRSRSLCAGTRTDVFQRLAQRRQPLEHPLLEGRAAARSGAVSAAARGGEMGATHERDGTSAKRATTQPPSQEAHHDVCRPRRALGVLKHALAHHRHHRLRTRTAVL
jgi:hypothetical protein